MTVPSNTPLKANNLSSKTAELELILQNHEFTLYSFGDNQCTPKIKGYYSDRGRDLMSNIKGSHN